MSDRGIEVAQYPIYSLLLGTQVDQAGSELKLASLARRAVVIARAIVARRTRSS